MDGLCEVFNKMSINDYKVGEHYWVHVTHINHPHDFYVRPADYKYSMNMLERRGDRARSADLIPGKILIFKSELMNKFIRGKVLNVQHAGKNSRHCDMLALDYGCVEFRVPSKGIHKIENNTSFPPTVVKCRLANCQPLSGNIFDAEAILAMKTFVGYERARMLVISQVRDQLVVELVNTCPNEIGQLMALTGHTTMGIEVKQAVTKIEAPRVLNEKIKYPMLIVGDILHVRMQSGLSLNGFYVAKANAYKRFLKYRDDFTDYCRNQKELSGENVIVGDLVGVLGQMSLNYERAVITEIKPNDRVVVQQLDWGNTIEVNLYQLRWVSPNIFHDEPALAIFCTVEQSEMANEDLYTCLNPGYEFFIRIISLGNSINIPHTVYITQVFKRSNQ